ncbi:MAG: heavy-metal-associated domain-containing protein [Prolixibacteraceae bacterium]|nr:heavy-metal-associated domain-containing protein [Prolixibacteraceae bacterium]
MNTLKFKTNVKCGGCIATVTPHLNQLKGIISWNVDTTDPLKIMTVETEEISAEEITSVMKTAGYQAELILSE